MEMFKKHAEDILKKAAGIKDVRLEIPPDSAMGDFAFPCFELSKNLKKSPNDISKELADTINSYNDNIISEAKAVGPYLNLFVNPEYLARTVLEEIQSEGLDYGKGKQRKERVMIEYCQVNTHKAFHVGHLRGTILGSSLVNIYRFFGYNTISANYQGDIGAHVAKVIWYLTKFKDDIKYPTDHKGRWLGKIYQKANSILEENKDAYKQEVSEVLQKLENKDPDISKLWEETRKWSLDDFEEFYKVLGVKFDEYFFESQFEKKGKEIVKRMLDSGLAEKSDGAIIIDLERYGLGKFLLLKSDGTALYSTKDLALASEKFDKYKVDKSLYIVGAEQKLYFQQIFKTLELIGFEKAKECVHIPYGLVNLPGGKISSREGELIYAEELVDEVIESAYKEIRKRHDISESEAKERAKAIGMAALKFSFLNQDNNKEIIFDKEKSLSFEGETGPYVQYAYARICSIFSKHGSNPDNADISLLKEAIEKDIIKMLSGFPEVVADSAKSYKPSMICRYLLDLAQMFNEYYHKIPILKSEDDLKEARLVLIECVKIVIQNGLNLLGICTIEEM